MIYKSAEIAQSVEQRIENPRVTSSILVLGKWKGVRVVYGVGLENQCDVSYRGFDSHPFRFLRNVINHSTAAKMEN